MLDEQSLPNSNSIGIELNVPLVSSFRSSLQKRKPALCQWLQFIFQKIVLRSVTQVCAMFLGKTQKTTLDSLYCTGSEIRTVNLIL